MAGEKKESVRNPTKFMGAYQLENTLKRRGGKPDLCFYITYKQLNGKKIWEKIGWRKDKPLKDSTPPELEDLKTSLLSKGLAPASVKLTVGNVRRVYNKMTEWDLYSGPKPMDRGKMPKVDNTRDRFLTPDGAQTLLAAVKKRSQLGTTSVWPRCIPACAFPKCRVCALRTST